ncbi:SemiSWEET family sugar transporter [Mucilaginibacter auburnensis]|uniref:MtN3 and saliva related transmembrane protein n=1 Tax=Mucilaginibacter auburnensis TaxID=1457233 RepID=A0A2H9VNW1_9SPHI|nr:SemiSWEET transporter [Mucilaginibacter auburnensis]PJJ80038.1 MtN3 and saliva related transmembrane protein [Mucilaginibacter auburnensis]
MESTQILGLVAGVCTSAASLPQIITTIKTKKAADVSPFMFIVLLTGNSLWVWYGFIKSDFPIIATNIVSIILSGVMLYLKFKYHKKDE